MVGLFQSCWYSRPILDRVHERISEAEFDEDLDRVLAFEGELADDGALILKYWMHLGKKAQKERLSSLEKDPLTRWRVTQADWDHWHMYDKFVAAAERVIMRTSTGKAPWRIVEGFDRRYRHLTVASTFLEAARKRLEETALRAQVLEEMRNRAKNANELNGGDAASAGSANESVIVTLPKVTILNSLDMGQSIERKEYKKQLEALQGKLNMLCRQAKEMGISTILVFEGWDAAGKGGAIRRVTAALDARDVRVIPIAAPTDEERAQHYLWRFWRHLSRAGRLTVFDRSWYGRVLVERVEGFATEEEWSRAYVEINDFEEQLVRHGIVLCKFWIHITKDEQLARFKAREGVEYKRWKLTDEDWRNRERWDEYDLAVNDMVEHTSTTLAPWTLIEGNDKPFARVKVLKTVCERIKKGIERREASLKPSRGKKAEAAG